MRMYDIIMKKRNGGTLSKEEIHFMIDGYVAGGIPDTYWAQIDYEQLLTWNPDYIILASDERISHYDIPAVGDINTIIIDIITRF